MCQLAVSPYVSVEMLCGSSKIKAPLNANIVMVLREIDRLGSVNKAVKHLHMGYSNTLYAIAAIEEALECPIVVRVRPQGSTLTEEGHRLIEMFDELQTKTQQYAEGVLTNKNR